jgi:eukaryotic-like serine/threonine-protein kinase
VFAPEPGLRIAPHLVLDRPLVYGGVGAVWVAHHETLKSDVAVKLLAMEVVDDETMRARFEREASAAMKVQSPHVVQILDFGVNEHNVPYLVMELLNGVDLEGLIAEHGALPPSDVVSIVTQIAKGLHAAHEVSVLHRDVKSSNVFLSRSDGWGDAPYHAKLVDFGMAKQIDKVTKQLTEQGTIIGTPQYMSPEQMMGLEIDARSDLWSLGVIAFEALTGQRPFTGDSIKDFGDAVHKKPLPKPRDLNPTLPPKVDDWFAKACARDPAERFQTARDLAEAFALAVIGEPKVLKTTAPAPLRRPKISIAIAITAVVLVALLVIWVRTR